MVFRSRPVVRRIRDRRTRTHLIQTPISESDDFRNKLGLCHGFWCASAELSGGWVRLAQLRWSSNSEVSHKPINWATIRGTISLFIFILKTSDSNDPKIGIWPRWPFDWNFNFYYGKEISIPDYSVSKLYRIFISNYFMQSAMDNWNNKYNYFYN